MTSLGINYEEDLVSRIRDLIDGYSKDSILKEYLQNADDSGATELIVTYDKRVHLPLDKTDYELAMGPALLLYNNSKFKENDFKSIVRISAQGKSGDANSTGRFGQGFSSSFSISDHPSFISNGRTYWFDVLKKAVSQNKSESIQAWKEENFSEIEGWLKTFKIPNQETNQFSGTIFRLPLRNEKTALGSEISNEVFTHNDFFKWCDEWKNNADNLLFLRHIHRLVLQEIDEGGNLIIHLDINTKNSKEIADINNSIQNEFNESLLNICNAWKAGREELPLFKYKHKFNISYFNREEKVYYSIYEVWAVVNGLFRGENDCLIDQAIKVLNISPNPRKVLPWAGVAIKLDGQNKHLKSQQKFYTFLPLPINSNHPVHIHGWFDLNPKRTEITHEGEGEDKEILIEWNQRLMREAVGRAWALLVDHIKDEKNLASYYGLWAKNDGNELDEYLIEGFYQEISKLKSFYCLYKGKKEWKIPADNIYFLKKIKNEILLDAFKEHFQIISPVPKQYIVNNLSNAGVELGEITPDFIRNTLRENSKDIDFPIALSEMSIIMLAKYTWFLEVLTYCADEGEDYSKVDSLPLELTLNKNIYKVGIDTLFDETPNLQLFQNRENLFLDPELARLIKNIDTTQLPSSWLQSSFKNTIVILKSYIDDFDLNKDWIQYFVNYLSDIKKSEIGDSIDELKSLAIVYQEDEEYARLESNISEYSPVIVKHEEINENIKYLKEISMNLVHPDYIGVYQPLLKYNGFITELSSKTLAKHLLTLNDYSFFMNTDTREFLVDLLATDTKWYTELDEDEIEKFSSIPFIQTESDHLYGLSTDKKLFLPTDFEPPKHIKNLNGDYELVTCIDLKHHSMLKEMGIEEQSSINYLKEIIIPYIEDSSEIDERNNILKWLSGEWENLTSKLDDFKKNLLIEKLRSVKIIPNKINAGLEEAANYYHPSFSSQLPAILQDKEFFPIEFTTNKDQEEWAKFLTVLDASSSIIPQQIICKVEKIIAERNQSGAISLLNYISNQFEEFEELRYKSRPILEHLKKLAWYPTERPHDIIRPVDEYSLLKQSKELILLDDIKIAGGTYYALNKKVRLGKKDSHGEYSKKDMAKALGIITYLPVDSSFISFKQLIEVKATSDQLNSKILSYAKEFYKFLGRKNATDIPDYIKEKSIRINNQWISSKNVFQQKINLTGVFDWNSLVDNEHESDLAKGLKLLGIEEKPSISFLIQQLQSLPIKTKLEKHYLRDSKSILNELQNDTDVFIDDELPLLSQNDQLIEQKNLYINDLPAYKNATKNNKTLMFCQVQFNQLAKRLGVISLAEKVEPLLNTKDSEFISANKLDSNCRLDNYINNNSFKSAVLRLNYHEGNLTEEEINYDSLVTILPLEIQFCRKLVINYQINDIWVYTDGTASTFEDEKERKLFILDQDDIEDMCDSVSEYICDAGNLPRDSFKFISRILRNRMNTTSINGLLDKNNIKALPEKLDIADDFSIYENKDQSTSALETSTAYIEEANDVNKTGSLAQSEEPVELNGNSDFLEADTDDTDTRNFTSPASPSKEVENNSSEIAPQINPKAATGTPEFLEADTDDRSYSNNSSTSIPRNENSISGAEIPPPITPKSSAESEKEEIPDKPYSPDSYNGNNRNKSPHSTNNSASKKIVSRNDRMPVYVGKDKEIDENTQNNQKERAKEIGDKGENLILSTAKEYLLSEENYFEKAPVNNKGFDIYEKNSKGNTVRYIEVKTLTGPWRLGGVGITESQLEFAQKNENWWLFVVENINTNNTSVFQFNNPILEANSFMFDNSWKQLACNTNNDIVDNIPKVGYFYDLGEDDKIYEVLSVKPNGELYKVKLRAIETLEIKKTKFNPSWKKQ